MVAVALCYGVSFHNGTPLPRFCWRHDGGNDEHDGEECIWDPDASFFVPCGGCRGNAPSCERCEGHGFEPIAACPWSFDLRGAWEFIALHEVWPSCLPLGGGLWNQPAPYVSAMRLIDRATKLIQGAKKPHGRD